MLEFDARQVKTASTSRRWTTPTRREEETTWGMAGSCRSKVMSSSTSLWRRVALFEAETGAPLASQCSCGGGRPASDERDGESSGVRKMCNYTFSADVIGITIGRVVGVRTRGHPRGA